MQNNKNTLNIVVALFIGIIIGYILGSSRVSNSNQGARVSSSVDTLSLDKTNSRNSSDVKKDEGTEVFDTSYQDFLRTDESKSLNDTIITESGEKLVKGSIYLRELVNSGSGNKPEIYECSDGINNDSDGFIDFPADPGCYSAIDSTELDPAPPTEEEPGLAHGTRVFNGSAHLFSTSIALNPSNTGSAYQLSTCAIQTTTCPGFGHPVEIIIVGPGSTGVDGQKEQGYQGGAGGSGGGAGGYFRGIMDIPADGSVLGFSGNLGRVSGIAQIVNDPDWAYIKFNSPLFDFGMPVSFNVKVQQPGGQNPLTQPVLTVFPGKSSWCGPSSCNPNNNSISEGGLVYISSSNYIFQNTFSYPSVVMQQGGWGANAGGGLLCSGSDGGFGGTGWNTPVGVRGAGTNGGKGGYANRLFQCLQHQDDWGLSRTVLPSANSDSVVIFSW